MNIDNRSWTNLDELGFKEALEKAQEARQRVEQHDPQTQKHGSRVAQWALAIAQQLPTFDRRRLRRLEISALLHDYGKLMIPSEVLNKAGPLDEDEWALVRRHPEIGAMMAPVNTKFILSEAILWHHKSFDGGGYPASLIRGRQIPIEARITTVADVFDAITSSRAYHCNGEGQSTTKAIETLRDGTGTLFDPALVTLFEKVYLDTLQQTGTRVGVPTLAIASILTMETERVHKYLKRELGSFDRKDPLGGEQAPPGMVDRMAQYIVRSSLDFESARTLVKHVLKLALSDTYHDNELAMTDAELRYAVKRVGNHQEAVIYIKEAPSRRPYMSVVVFRGEPWFCVGESAGERTAISLIK